jgi:hypothetical protein
MKLLQNIFFTFLALLSTLVVCEIYIRLTYIANVSMTEFDEGIGKERGKNFGYLFFNEGFGIGKINEFRYIGEPNPPLKPENTTRIALLGDSFIEAYQVFDRQYFGNIAENILKAKYPGKNFEILNFGCAGFEITDMYAYQKNTIEKFNPDYLFYLVSKDDLEPENSDSLRPSAIIINDSLIISYAFNPHEAKKFNRANFFLRHSAILNMLNDCRRKTKTIPIESIFLGKLYVWFFNPEKIAEVPENKKSNYTVHPVTGKIIESLDPEKVLIINRGEVSLPIEFIRLCEKRGLLYFDLGSSLVQLKNAGNDPQEWKVTGKHGHWNYYGHKVAGAEISNIVSGLVEK